MPSKFILWGICRFVINKNWADAASYPYMRDCKGEFFFLKTLWC